MVNAVQTAKQKAEARAARAAAKVEKERIMHKAQHLKLPMHNKLYRYIISRFSEIFPGMRRTPSPGIAGILKNFMAPSLGVYVYQAFACYFVLTVL